MPAARQPISHLARLGGMDRGVRPHTISDDRWRTVEGMRSLETELKQVPAKKVLYYALASSEDTLLSLTALPSGHENNAFVIGLTSASVMCLRKSSARQLLKGATAVVMLKSPSSGYRRWGTAVYNSHLFFVNENNPVHYTDGANVKAVGGDTPSGRYVEVFFDHLVVGCPLYRGEALIDGVRWSHLQKFDKWAPASDSEADAYYCHEYQGEGGEELGVTGIRKIGEVCYIYTPRSLYGMQYVGLPRVVRVTPVVQDYGNGFKYSLVSISRLHFFIDAVERNFYAFDGMAVHEIGQEIKAYFFDDLNATYNLRQRTWGYANQEKKEVTWVYVSKDSAGDFDKSVSFNYKEKRWTVRPVENVHSHCGATAVARTIRELQMQMSSVSTSVDSLGASGDTLPELWGGANTRVMAEVVDTDLTNKVLYLPAPVLETGDFVYGSVQTVKETDSVNVQSSFASANGVSVDLATRKLLDEVVTFQNVGLWKPTLPEERLTFKPRRGKVLRWRFSPTADGVPNIIVRKKTGLAAFSITNGFITPQTTVPNGSGSTPGGPWTTRLDSSYVASSGTINFTDLSPSQQLTALEMLIQEMNQVGGTASSISLIYWVGDLYPPNTTAKSIVTKDASGGTVAGTAPGEGTVLFSSAPKNLTISWNP